MDIGEATEIAECAQRQLELGKHKSAAALMPLGSIN